MYLIIKKFSNGYIGVTRRCNAFADALAVAQSRDDKGISIVIVWIWSVNVDFPSGIIIPAHRPTAVKEDVVALVKASVGLA